VIVVGIAGGSGSGKSTLAEAVVAAVGPERAVVIPQDAYYRPRSLAAGNYDEPAAFDDPLLATQLAALRRGERIARPIYDFTIHDRLTETLDVDPVPVVIVEGILVLASASLRGHFDLRLFVDTPADERFIRRLQRDVAERGRSVASVIERHRRDVGPMHDLHCQPTRAHADLIVPGTGGRRQAVEVLIAWVAQRTAGPRP
jgi:uridine kinase